MNQDNTIYFLNRKAILAAMVSAAFPVGANAAAGKVEFASGGAAVQSADGSSKVMTKGMEINQGDTILTGAGRAQVKFTDGGYISFQPNTEFKVEEYNFNGKQDGTEKGFFKLVEGGLRALTGLVGRENRPAYRMSTPVATIGIRGSYYLAQFRNNRLDAHVGQGSIFVFNENGDIILFQGQGATVEGNGAPGYSESDLNLGARGPDGGQPQETDGQQQAENRNNNIFKVSEIYNENGVSTSLGETNISAVIANLNGINAEGVYKIDPTVANMGSGAGWSTKINPSFSELRANFGNYSMFGSIGLDSVGTITSSGSGSFTTSASNSFFVTGSILPSGSFGLSGGSGGGVCYDSCTLNIVGFFSGAQAERASVGYVLNGVRSPDYGIINGKINGSAGFIAIPPPAPGGFGFGGEGVFAP